MKTSSGRCSTGSPVEVLDEVLLPVDVRGELVSAEVIGVAGERSAVHAGGKIRGRVFRRPPSALRRSVVPSFLCGRTFRAAPWPALLCFLSTIGDSSTWAESPAGHASYQENASGATRRYRGGAGWGRKQRIRQTGVDPVVGIVNGHTSGAPAGALCRPCPGGPSDRSAAPAVESCVPAEKEPPGSAGSQ